MRNYLEQNLQYLAYIDKDLAQRISQIKNTDGIQIFAARNGQFSVKIKTQDGESVLLHSAYDPSDEARRFITANFKEDTEAFLVSGFGFGYSALELVKIARPDMWLVFVEASPEIFYLALNLVDLRPVFCRQKVAFFVGNNFTQFLSWLRDFLSYAELYQVTYATYTPCMRVMPEFYAKAMDELKLAIQKRAVEVNTLIALWQQMETNAIRNLIANKDATGIKNFCGICKDIPGIVVAAGPSLEDNLHLLKGIKNKAVIICVGKSLKLLLREGIVPEFTAHLDMTEIGKRYYQDLPADLPSVLFYDPDTYYEIPQSYPGRKVTFDSAVPFNIWCREFIGEKGFLEKGLSVAHTSFYLARALGVNPIILVGVDLAIPTDKTHAQGTVVTWGKDMQEISPQICYVPAIKGGEVRSLQSFKSFITTFEADIANTKATVINTSQIGALIRCAINLSLEEAIQRYCIREYPVDEIISRPFAVKPVFNKDVFKQESKKLLQQMEDIQKYCQEGLWLLKRFQRTNFKLKTEVAYAQKIADQLNYIIGQILSCKTAAFVLRRAVSKASLLIRQINREIFKNKDEDKRKELEIQRAALFFNGYMEAIEFYKKVFEPVREKLLSE